MTDIPQVDLAWLTITEAAALIRTRKLSPVEYTEGLLSWISAVDPRLNAFIRVTGEIALAEAKAAEAEIAGGNYRGPMHGIPYGLKDIIDYAGVETTAHSKVLDGYVPKQDAFTTAKLRAAGSVLLGKLSTHEFATGGPIFDLPFPPARNPWNRDHHPGGSSSGSGSALGAGMVPAALGTDTGGSVRNPASMCAIVGMKPTYGRVSRRGVVPLSFSLDHVGPMTRTVRDNAILLQTIAGYDAADPGSADEPVPDFSAQIDAGVKGMKIGVIRHFYNRDRIARQDMGAAIEEALKVLESLGATIVELNVSPLAHFMKTSRIISPSEAFSVHEKWLKEKPEAYGSHTRVKLLQGASHRAVDYISALRNRARLKAEIDDVFKDVDAIVTASSMEPAARIDDWAEVSRTYELSARNVFNVTGHPAVALPTGFSAEGLPLAMQIAGRTFDEATMLRVANAYELATEWHTRHPVFPDNAKAAAE